MKYRLSSQMHAKSADVKDFEQKMVDAHTKTTNELKCILMKSAPDFTPPLQLDARREGLLNDLKGAKDADFEGRYVAQQINTHNEALIVLHGYATDGDNPDIDIDRAYRARDAQARNNSSSNTKTR